MMLVGFVVIGVQMRRRATNLTVSLNWLSIESAAAEHSRSTSYS